MVLMETLVTQNAEVISSYRTCNDWYLVQFSERARFELTIPVTVYLGQAYCFCGQTSLGLFYFERVSEDSCSKYSTKTIYC